MIRAWVIKGYILKSTFFVNYALGLIEIGRVSGFKTYRLHLILSELVWGVMVVGLFSNRAEDFSQLVGHFLSH